MHDLRRGKLVFLTDRLEFTPACREHVLHPLRLAAVRERDNESVGHSKHVDGRSVKPARFAADVTEDSEAGEPASKQSGDSVREDNVNFRQPPLTETHHQDACDGNCDGDGGSDAHRFELL